MKYSSIRTAKFISRPNRFIAYVELDGSVETVHVKNTGRCKEILKEGVTVILEEAGNPNRKTRYSLVAAYKGDMLINIDSQIPNAVAYESMMEGAISELGDIDKLSREVVHGKSRFDLYYEKADVKGFVEVKGVTLETEGVAMFPDAPTQRGSKHVNELAKAVDEGYECSILFLIQMKGIRYFTPFVERDPEFAAALKAAYEKGVRVLAYDTVVTADELVLDKPVEVRL